MPNRFIQMPRALSPWGRWNAWQFSVQCNYWQGRKIIKIRHFVPQPSIRAEYISFQLTSKTYAAFLCSSGKSAFCDQYRHPIIGPKEVTCNSSPSKPSTLNPCFPIVKYGAATTRTPIKNGFVFHFPIFIFIRPLKQLAI